MEVLLLNGKYSEQLTALGDKLSDIQKKLLQDEESLHCEIKTSVITTKAATNFAEEHLLSELRNTFESYQTTLRRQVTNVKDLQKEITNLEAYQVTLPLIAAYTLESAEIHEDLNSTKTLRCRFHDKEEYQLFCNDCKDFVCFECLGQLHQKHDICSLQNAEENIKKEIRNVLLGDNFIEQLHILSENFTEQKKELFQDEESLKHEIRSKVKKVRKQLNLSEKYLLSEVCYTFKGYQTSLKEKETSVNILRTKLTNLDVDKLDEHNLDYIMNTLSEMKLCSSTCYKHKKDQQAVLSQAIEFSIKNMFKATDKKFILKDPRQSQSSFSNIATQTDYHEDSDTEWFDAEDGALYDLSEKILDKGKNKYPITVHFNHMKLVNKIVPISGKDAWLLSNRQLHKIVNLSLEYNVYADRVDDFVVLKDGCVLILSSQDTFIMKLLTGRRPLKFANVGRERRTPISLCVYEDDLLVIHLSSFGGGMDYVIWMNTDGVFINEESVSNINCHRLCLMRILEPYLCVVFRTGSTDDTHSIELLERKDNTYHSFKSFRGMYGFDADKHFQCNGMCVAKDFSIIISDFHHHRVYVLDKELKYKKTLFDERNGLDTPSAISIFNDYIWIADRHQIFIFPFDNA